MLAAAAAILFALNSAQSQTLSAPARTSRSGVYSAAQAERGRMQYAVSCRSCHTAASHTGVTFAKWWKDRTVGDLYAYMSSQMPKNDPGSLEPDQYADVVAYLLKMNAMPPGKSDLFPHTDSLSQIRIELPPARARKIPVRKDAPTRKKSP